MKKPYQYIGVANSENNQQIIIQKGENDIQHKNADFSTYDCNGWTQTTVGQEEIFKLKFSKRFIWIWIKRRPFNSSPRTNDCVPAEDAVQDAAVLLEIQPHHKYFYNTCQIARIFVHLEYGSFMSLQQRGSVATCFR